MDILNIVECEKCGSENMGVLDTRMTCGIIRRRRRCLDCGNRITTYEIHEEDFHDRRTKKEEFEMELEHIRGIAKSILEME